MNDSLLAKSDFGLPLDTLFLSLNFKTKGYNGERSERDKSKSKVENEFSYDPLVWN